MEESRGIISVIFEDNDILVINKPAGITVNRAETTIGEVTIQDWAEDRLGNAFQVESSKYKQQEELRNKEELNMWDPVRDFYLRGGIVHRLDKETSGVLLLAKNPEAFKELQRQFKERVTKKTYVALAHGKVVPEEGEIAVPVGRLPWNRKQFGVVAGGRESITKYRTLQSYELRLKHQTEKLTLLELYPETGRTHQIRVHLKYIGHPIFADFLYAGRKTQREDRKALSRVFLHAAKISFLHPKTGKEVTFESPLPDELQAVINSMQTS